MNRILTENINWDALDLTDRSQAVCEILDAFILKSNRLLHILVSLNFVMPEEAEQRARKQLMDSIPGIEGGEIVYSYDREHPAMEPERFLSDLVFRLVDRSDCPMKAAVRRGSADVEGDEIRIHALGDVATEELNRCLSRDLSAKIHSRIGRQVRVLFRSDEADYDEAEKAKKEHDRKVEKEQEETARKAASAPKKRKKESTQSSGGSFDGSAGGGGFRRREPKGPLAQGGAILGRPIHGDPVPLVSLKPDSGHVTVEGMLFKKDTRPVRNEKLLVSLLITDKKTSACLKFFIREEQWGEVEDKLKIGSSIAASGETEWNRFDNCLDIMVKNIDPRETPRRVDTWEGKKRVELHAHTKMSAMDGLNEVDQLVKVSAGWGQPAVAITDHGVVQGFPDAANAAGKCAKAGNPIKVLFGLEGYVFDDADCIREDGSIDYKKKGTNHIILLARTQEGLKNIYKLVSVSHLNYFYKRPRIPWSVLEEHREGIIVGSACEAGEVYRSIRDGLSEEEIERIASRYDYLEIQPLINDRFMVENGLVSGWEDLRNINRKILALGDKLGKPVCATTDAHYDEPESAIYRNILMAGMGFKDAEQGQGLYLRTTAEMMEEFSYLGEDRAYEVVVENTNKIADMIDDGILPVPKGKFPPRIEGAEETLRTTCMNRAHEIYGDPLPDIIQERLDTELNAIIGNGYAVMYVSAQMLVHKSNEDGYLVGSRGSVGSSLAATMAGITEVNPLDPHYICPNCKHLEWGDMQKYDCGVDMPVKNCPECGTEMKRDGFTIPFATFLGFKGNKEPDIDLNFAGEYQPRAHKYVGEIFGEKNVFKAGTVGTVADKTAYGYVMKFAEETGRPINKFEADRLAQGCTGVKRTTGQHPGGIVIVPDDHEIYEFCPVQHPANDTKSDIVTTHFDYHKIDQNLLKLDILGHNVPSQIRQLQDMTGIDPMDVDLSDRSVLTIFNGLEALDIKDPDYRFTHGSYAIPEFGTSFVRQMLDDAKPDKFADLVRISGFSHGTDVWLGNAQEYIRNGTATMSEVISTRDDIMNYLILKGVENETAFRIMEDVRKPKLVVTEEDESVMKEHGVPDWYIDSCKKIKYMFPRAHAVAYVMMSFRLAWYKVYYPPEFYATFFSTVVNSFNADVILKGKQAVLDRMDEIAMLGNNATAKDKDELTVLEVAYEMYARGYAFTDAELGASHALKFWVKDGKVLLPFAAFSGVGETAARALADAYEEHPFDTVEDAMNRSHISKAVVDVLREHGVFRGLPETDQLSWVL